MSATVWHVNADEPSALDYEDVSLQLATIHWMPFGEGQARFQFTGEFDLPEDFARGDLSRDMTLCVTIAGETGCDTVALTKHPGVRHYHGADGTGEGIDVEHTTIVWLSGRTALVIVRGGSNLPGVDQDTTPAEATVEFSFPISLCRARR